MTPKEQQLANQLYQRMHADEKTLQYFQKHPYYAKKETVHKFWEYIEQAPKVVIIGDYDVDGICASHILLQSIRHVYPGKSVRVRIPHRFSEGYGINEAIAQEIIEKDPKNSLIITVDNGIAAAPVINKLKEAGFPVIVTDHHSLREGASLPECDMLIDPSVEAISNPLEGRYWCGAGVAYKLCEQMLQKEKKEELSIFAALATVSDCMDLKEGNWGLVKNALKLMHRKKCPESIKLLLEQMGKDPYFCTEGDFGWYLGPAFNASGRLLDAGAVEVLKYLHHPTKEGCNQIITLNEQRKSLAEEQTERVRQYIKTNHMEEEYPLWLNVPGLHEGIIGIIAGRIAEEFKRPVILVTPTENKEHPDYLKGSARSYGTFDIFAYLSGFPDYFVKMGGHAGAAGLTITADNIELARKEQKIDSSILQEFIDPTLIETKIEPDEVPGMYVLLQKFAPFGQGNSEPIFECEVNDKEYRFKFIGAKSKKEDTTEKEQADFAMQHLIIQKEKNNDYNLVFWRCTEALKELKQEHHFGMRGTISGNPFKGQIKPQFVANSAFDVEEDLER